MRAVEFVVVENVTIDNRDGWGAVPWNQEVDYRGLRVKMKPSVFLALADTLSSAPKKDIVQHIQSGGAIGAPFLQIRIDDNEKYPIVVGHDGRNRMKSIQQVHGNRPIEVHLFFQGNVSRARHLTPEIVKFINSGMISQNNTWVNGPLFNNEKIVESNDIHPDVVKAYQKTLDADDQAADYNHRSNKAKATKARNHLSKMINKHYPDLDSRGKIALRTKLQNLNENTRHSALLEGYKLQLERGSDMDVLHITDTKTGKRTEVRGKPNYEIKNDPEDPLHRLLDRIGKAANISDLINGEVVGINPRHPDGASAKKHTDIAFGEDDEQTRDMRRLLVTPEHPLGKYLYHLTGADGLLGMLQDGHLGEEDEYFSMTADPKYDVGGGAGWTQVNIIIDSAKVKNLPTFEKHMENWEWGKHGSGDWAKQPGQDWESEYRVEEAIPLSAVVAVKILKSAATPEIIKLAKQRNIRLIGKDTSVQENFADGKVKGKSRPGRVKRAGASCKGSVTDLRAKAKKYSGERGKMYHWCANMKAGKKK